MKVWNEMAEPPLHVTLVVEFNPWPFAEDVIDLTGAVSWLEDTGDLRSPPGGGVGPWALNKDGDSRLGLLSDGTVAVVANDYDGRAVKDCRGG